MKLNSFWGGNFEMSSKFCGKMGNLQNKYVIFYLITKNKAMASASYKETDSDT